MTWAIEVFPLPDGPQRDARGERIGLNRPPERGVGSDQMDLSHDLVKGARPHPCGQRRGAVHIGCVVERATHAEIGERSRSGHGSGWPSRQIWQTTGPSQQGYPSSARADRDFPT